jgi:hypothetical protein
MAPLAASAPPLTSAAVEFVPNQSDGRAAVALEHARELSRPLRPPAPNERSPTGCPSTCRSSGAGICTAVTDDAPIDPKTLQPGTCIEYEWSSGDRVRRDPSGIFLGCVGDDQIKIGWDDETSRVYSLTSHRIKILRARDDPDAIARWRNPGRWSPPNP